jgi:hypothetical protein
VAIVAVGFSCGTSSAFTVGEVLSLPGKGKTSIAPEKIASTVSPDNSGGCNEYIAKDW